MPECNMAKCKKRKMQEEPDFQGKLARLKSRKSNMPLDKSDLVTLVSKRSDANQDSFVVKNLWGERLTLHMDDLDLSKSYAFKCAHCRKKSEFSSSDGLINHYCTKHFYLKPSDIDFDFLALFCQSGQAEDNPEQFDCHVCKAKGLDQTEVFWSLYDSLSPPAAEYAPT